ncbi:MAG: hypothetical protein ACI9EF_003616 [Pseudohongiellaceae bacterium]|jgi:hypothetical protein
MNIRKLKSLLWVCCALAFLGAGYTFYDIWVGKKELRYEARDADVFHKLLHSKVAEVESLRDGSTYYSVDRYEGLWLARLDGSLPPVPEDVQAANGRVAEEQSFMLPPLNSILNVGLILYSDESTDRFVALRYIDGGQDQAQLGKARRLHVSEGESLKSPYDAAPYFGKLLSIGKQTVTFRWGENEETVTPGLGAQGDQSPIDEWAFGEVTDITAGIDEVPEESVELEPGQWLVGTNDLVELNENAHDILSEDLAFRTLPPTGESKRSVLELTHVEPGSLPSRYGFASGDRVISVNGIPMTSIASATNWYKQNSDLASYHVIYQRLGAQKSMTLHNKNN